MTSPGLHLNSYSRHRVSAVIVSSSCLEDDLGRRRPTLPKAP